MRTYSLCFALLISSPLMLMGATTNQSGSNASTQEKFNLMERDEKNGTDALAIPFDESEIEDEQQINMDEKKDVFQLPHSPGVSAK